VERGTHSKKGRRTIWPQEGGLAIEPNFTYIEEIVNGTRHFPLWYTQEVYDRWRQYYPDDNVFVWNIEHDENPVSSFICDILKAPTACQASQQVVASYADPSTSIDCDILAVAAKSKGWVAEGLERKMVTRRAALEYHKTQTHHDFTKMCPTRRTDLEPLWKKTMEYERRLVPAFFNTSHVSCLTVDFGQGNPSNRVNSAGLMRMRF
jgi:hypothetical protein